MEWEIYLLEVAARKRRERRKRHVKRKNTWALRCHK